MLSIIHDQIHCSLAILSKMSTIPLGSVPLIRLRITAVVYWYIPMQIIMYDNKCVQQECVILLLSEEILYLHGPFKFFFPYRGFIFCFSPDSSKCNNVLLCNVDFYS